MEISFTENGKLSKKFQSCYILTAPRMCWKTKTSTLYYPRRNRVWSPPTTPGALQYFLNCVILMGEKNTGVCIRFIWSLNWTIMPQRIRSYCGVFVPCLFVFCQSFKMEGEASRGHPSKLSLESWAAWGTGKLKQIHQNSPNWGIKMTLSNPFWSTLYQPIDANTRPFIFLIQHANRLKFHKTALQGNQYLLTYG